MHIIGKGCSKEIHSPGNFLLHQPIEMKFGMSHYSHKSIPDAKSGSGSSSSYGDMMSQNFPWKKGMSHQIRLFTPGKQVLT